ncbi:hypothetical protein D1610_06875 [Sphingomonas gilva]|uniref:Phytanoyl-CoA dioxygenase family protein n=1 Tax=Sphingomonas gilva TaxID=2305907 RepID=A0A396RNV7_9SPHN|nr:phytanoyl-CoA dioxygenase family protein [Sphingomonas gilva]RHW18197.1 hypothetical protein D1610_06875 [Sphingomonas gilva]
MCPRPSPPRRPSRWRHEGGRHDRGPRYPCRPASCSEPCHHPPGDAARPGRRARRRPRCALRRDAVLRRRFLRAHHQALRQPAQALQTCRRLRTARPHARSCRTDAAAVVRPHRAHLTQAVEIHPGALAQYPHRDEDMWQGPKGELEYLVNVMWPLTPFTADNGATMVWPGSHCGASGPAREEDAVAAAMDPGDVLVFLGSTLHAGGANRTGRPRRGLIVSYGLGWLKPFENQWLVYPPEIARTFDPELAALVGYAEHRPNLGNVEGQCPSALFAGPLPDHVAATDALRPDQAEALAAHVAEQRAAGDR